ncbi:hypothetical protein F1D05_38215 [Kribbella qitaiheensis]|uniref:GH26 domain-containing protein n=1 Tax=Kribbella qitaiheensis TaxID=1544730 RepID=A0A7G6X8V6_9ACTN|nr:hypothetical protein [Kribbella qitaiheensis]QNE22671.1 hypothetical protein F1D05_38215 [Kribbella qitaiheensis]
MILAVTAINNRGSDQTKPVVPANPSESSTPGACLVSDLLVPSCGVLFGAATNPLGDESWDDALTSFEKTIGRTVDIAHYYNSSPDLFPDAEMIQRAREPGRKRLLLLNWKPEMDRTWAQVAAGDKTVDAAIDVEAAYLKKNFPEKFYLAIHHEPEDEVDPAPGSGMNATDYKGMYRHVVLRLRHDGVTNAVFVMNYTGSAKWGSMPWFETLYPGDDVVDWIAEDPYIFGDPPHYWTDLASAVDRRDPALPRWPGFYSWALAAHPSKPLMLGECGIDEQVKNTPSKASLLAGIRTGLLRRPQIRALVYWNETNFDPVGETRLDSSPAAKRAARRSLSGGPLARQLG